jgi:hypothetical protein
MFDFTALSFFKPEKVRIRVKLEGQDQVWRELVNQRRVHYTNLPPRTYRFRVLACNDSGVCNEEGDFLDFSIAPAFCACSSSSARSSPRIGSVCSNSRISSTRRLTCA